MPRVKSLPKKRKGGELELDSLENASSQISDSDPISNLPSSSREECIAPSKQRKKTRLFAGDARSVKSISTTRLQKHRACGENAQHLLEVFDAYIRIHKNIEMKFQIVKVLLNVSEEDSTCNFAEDIYGLYVGSDDLNILCLRENNSQDGFEEQYFVASSNVPSEILSLFSTKYFIIRYAGSPSPGTLELAILLSTPNFPQISSPSDIPKNGVRSVVKKVMKFFYETEEKDDIPSELGRQQYLSQFFDSVQHENPLDQDVQHPNLIPQLRPYQIQAVQWMLSKEQKQCTRMSEPLILHPLFEEFTTLDGIKLYYNKVAGYFSVEPHYALPPCKGGILADEMGLGKTVEVLACILNNPKENVMESIGKFMDNQQHILSESELEAESSEDTFSCSCGVSCYEDSALEVVKCQICGVLQHAECFNNLPLSPDDVYYCPHCWVQDSCQLLPSGTTLIVSPHRISYQWEDEIRKHVRDKSLKILVYQGLRHHGFIQPQVLAQYDIVLTTYDVLKTELNHINLPYSARSRALRRPQKFYSPPSPLPAILWWRVCLDEAQMAEHATSKIAKMALQLNSVHRWCVTGTPLQRNVDDLYGLFMFLGNDPFCVREWWREALYIAFCNGDCKPLTDALKPILWRTMKKDVLDQINIPDQDTLVHWIQFSGVEEYFYTEQYHSCSRNLFNHISTADLNVQLNSLDKEFLNKVWIPVRELRQACCHPQVVKGHFAPVQKSFLAMSEVLENLIKKAQYRAEEYHRLLVGTLNGLAGIHIISMNLDDAVSYFKEALSSAYNHADKLRTDKLQLYHAFLNLSEVLTSEYFSSVNDLNDQIQKENLEDVSNNTSPEKQTSEHPAILEPLSPRKLAEEAEALKSSYLERTLTALENSRKNFLSVEQEVNDLAKCKKGQLWWICICKYATDIGKSSILIDKIQSELLAARIPGNRCLADQFHNVNGLFYVIYLLLGDLCKSHKLLKEAVNALPSDPSEEEVMLAGACHLRLPARPSIRKMDCQYCKVQQNFDDYGRKLFYCLEKTPYLVRNRILQFTNLQHFSSRDEGSSTSSSLNNPAVAQGTWLDSELEHILRNILLFGRNHNAKDEDLERGNKTLQWISALKKEFRALRNLWMKLMDRVSALDELKMASQRFRLKLPHEVAENTTASFILTEEQVETKKQKFLSEKNMYRTKLKEGLSKLLFLQNLKDLENEKNDKENCSSRICPVCRQQLRAMWIMLPCGHLLCSDCVKYLINKCFISDRPSFFRCPVCREITKNTEIFYVGKSTENPLDKEFPVQGSFSTKVSAIVQCLMKIKRNDPSAKSLVFSEWLDLLNIIASALEKNDIPFVFLCSKKTFQADLLRFKLDSYVNTALLPIYSCASGLNIIEATHVLLVEPQLHPSWELQAIGRVHRIGQTKKTVVHHFVMKDSIEEKIYRLLPSDCQSEDELKYKESCLTLKDLQELF